MTLRPSGLPRAAARRLAIRGGTMSAETVAAHRPRHPAAEAAENLRRWRESGQPRRWVEEREGRWGHAEWLDLLEALRWSHFWPVNTDAVGRVLEDTKRRYWNLRRWREAGHPRRWVEERQGRWAREDWLALL